MSLVNLDRRSSPFRTCARSSEPCMLVCLGTSYDDFGMQSRFLAFTAVLTSLTGGNGRAADQRHRAFDVVRLLSQKSDSTPSILCVEWSAQAWCACPHVRTWSARILLQDTTKLGY